MRMWFHPKYTSLHRPLRMNEKVDGRSELPLKIRNTLKQSALQGEQILIYFNAILDFRVPRNLICEGT